MIFQTKTYIIKIAYNKEKKVELNGNYFKHEETENKGNISLKEMVDLSDDEQILWTGKPNKKVYLLEQFFKMLPFVIIWLAFDSFFIYMMISNTNGSALPPGLIVFFIAFFAFHLMPVWFWLSNLLTARKRLKNLEYAFTNTRIIIKSGFFGQIDNIFYSEISSVNMRIGFLEKMFHVGDIYIRTTDSKFYTLENLSDPYFLTNKLQKIVVDIKTDIQFPNDLRPEENHGYKTKYKK